MAGIVCIFLIKERERRTRAEEVLSCALAKTAMHGAGKNFWVCTGVYDDGWLAGEGEAGNHNSWIHLWSRDGHHVLAFTIGFWHSSNENEEALCAEKGTSGRVSERRLYAVMITLCGSPNDKQNPENRDDRWLWRHWLSREQQGHLHQCCSLENFPHVYVLNEEWSNMIRRSFKRNFFTEQFHEKKSVLLMQKKKSRSDFKTQM